MEETKTNQQTGLPKGWTWATIGDMCEVIMGQSPPSETYNEEGKGLPFYQGKAEFGDLYPTPVKWCLKPSKIAEAGDVLISVRAPVGPTNLCRERSCIGRGLAALRAKTGVDGKYVLYSLRHKEPELASKATGTTFPAISGDVLRGQTIPLAPTAEQHRIVARIEELFTRLDAGVASLKRARANLKRYRAAVLKAACEGKLVPQDPNDEPASVLLERIRAERRARWEEELRVKGKDPRKAKYEEPAPSDTEGLPELPQGWTWATIGQLVRINYRDNTIHMLRDDLPVTFVPMAAIDGTRGAIISPQERPLSQVRKGFTSFSEGDVLFAKITPCMENGKAAIARGLTNGLGFGSTEFHVLRPEKWVLPEWIFYFIRQPSFREEAKANFAGTAGQLRVPSRFLENHPIPLPPLPEQHRIVAEIERRLSVVQELEATIEASLKRAERLRQAILRQAFEGKLVPQDPSDEPAAVLLERIRRQKEPQAQTAKTAKTLSTNNRKPRTLMAPSARLAQSADTTQQQANQPRAGYVQAAFPLPFDNS